MRVRAGEKGFQPAHAGAIRKIGVRRNGYIREKAYAYFDMALKENNFEVLLEKADTARQLRRIKQEGARVCEDLYLSR